MPASLWAKKGYFLDCTRAATAIEYGLIAAGIAVSIYAVGFATGDSMVNLFQPVSEALSLSSGS